MDQNYSDKTLSVISNDHFGFEFDNSYLNLPDNFFSKVEPTPVKYPKIFAFNEKLANKICIEFSDLSKEQKAKIFSGNILPSGAEPLSMVYAGHQFGGYVPQLGDGRAILIGEVVDKEGVRWDIQLKGAGPTPYSRGGDGRSALGPVIREYLLCEAMHALGVKTTRALAAVSTGQNVYRESLKPGGIFTRVALSHIRVGTFEFFARKQDIESVKILADYAINRLYPECFDEENRYISFYKSVLKSQAELVAKWLSLGFIHGVMNTDNMAISGETIDYGPCAFMDEYNPRKVFSSIDYHGRYAYSNQGKMAQWNLARLGETLIPLIDNDQKKAVSIVEELLTEFTSQFEDSWIKQMLLKIGIKEPNSNRNNDIKIVEELLNIMHENGADFTLSFRQLSKVIGNNNDKFKDSDHFYSLFGKKDKIYDWVKGLNNRLEKGGNNREYIVDLMNSVNPKYIPRNHLVEETIKNAEQNNDFKLFDQVLEVLSKPFDEQGDFEEFSKAPLPDQLVKQTFCGT